MPMKDHWERQPHPEGRYCILIEIQQYMYGRWRLGRFFRRCLVFLLIICAHWGCWRRILGKDCCRFYQWTLLPCSFGCCLCMFKQRVWLFWVNSGIEELLCLCLKSSWVVELRSHWFFWIIIIIHGGMRSQMLHTFEVSLEKPIDWQIDWIKVIKEGILMFNDISIDNRENAASNGWGNNLNIKIS